LGIGERRVIDVDDPTLQVIQHLSLLVIDAREVRHRRHRLQMTKQPVHRNRPRTCLPAYRVADTPTAVKTIIGLIPQCAPTDAPKLSHERLGNCNNGPWGESADPDDLKASHYVGILIDLPALPSGDNVCASALHGR
jgi:hypothetical protein